MNSVDYVHPLKIGVVRLESWTDRVRRAVEPRLRDAHDAGVKFFCCSPNLDLFDMKEDDLIEECEGIVGGAYLIEAVMEDDCRVLTY